MSVQPLNPRNRGQSFQKTKHLGIYLDVWVVNVFRSLFFWFEISVFFDTFHFKIIKVEKWSVISFLAIGRQYSVFRLRRWDFGRSARLRRELSRTLSRAAWAQSNAQSSRVSFCRMLSGSTSLLTRTLRLRPWDQPNGVSKNCRNSHFLR